MYHDLNTTPDTKSHSVLAVNFFADTNDFEGWTCSKITSCGKFGNVCGGFNVKGQGHDIKKTFEVPAGKYSVALDFIKIDSWSVY